MDTKKLRQKILDLAIRGKLVPQDPNDEPASVLLERIRAEKERLIKEGKIKRSKETAEDDKIEAPFEIPESWEWTKLGEISDYGTTINVDVKDIPQNGWVLELEDLEKDSATIIKRVTKGEREIKGVRHSFKKGDVLYSKLRTYLNKVLVAPDNGYCTTEIIPISFYSGVQPEYLNNVLRSKFFLDYTIQCGYGVKMPRLSTTDACNGLIPLPPLAEQKRIASEIERWFSVIDELESNEDDLLKAIDKAKSKILDLAIHGKLVPQDPNDEPAIELLKRINPKFEPCDNKLDDIQLPDSWCWTRGTDIFEPMKSTQPSSDTFKYIDIDAIDNKLNVITSVKVLSTKDAPSRASRYTEKGCVLFSMVRPYLRNIAIVPEDNCIASTGFYVCRTKEFLDSRFCYYLMLSNYVVDGLNEYMKGDNSPSINKRHLDSFVFPLPPYKEQLRIVSKIEEVFKALDALS